MEYDPKSRRPDAQDAMRGINQVSAAKAISKDGIDPNLIEESLRPLADLPAEELAKLGDVIERTSSNDK